MTLEERIAEKIAQIEANIAAWQIALDELKELLEAGEEGGGNAEGEASDASPSANGKPKRGGKPRDPEAATAKPGSWPAKLLRVLEGGPLSFGEILERTGAGSGSLGPVLRDHPWFRKVAPGGRRDPYELTAAGRQALASEPS